MRATLLGLIFCCAVACGEDKVESVLVLHKGDPFPPVGVLYSYDNDETQADFDRRRSARGEKVETRVEKAVVEKAVVIKCASG